MSYSQQQINKAQAVFEALLLGPVKNYGLLYKYDGNIIKAEGYGYNLNASDLADSIKILAKVGVIVSRTDSGGLPTWEIIEIKKKDGI